MASNYTENYGLCQWEATDQVLRTDFNEDNAKIDAALYAVKGCNCQLYTTAYTGTGKGEQSLTFPRKPLVVMAIGGTATWWCAIQGAPFLYVRYSGSSLGMPEATWQGNTLSWGMASNGSAADSGNLAGGKYNVVALLQVEN